MELSLTIQPARRKIDIFRRLPAIIKLWMRRARTRRALARLDGVRLDDIGISRSQALAEVCKPFWKK